MILTIGCSFTYGSELTNREETAWPYLLSKKLNTPVVNRAEGGASNDYIFRTAIEETVQTTYDLVIIQWSEPSRMEVWYVDRPISVTAHSNWKQIGQLSWMQDYYKYSYNDLFRYRTWYARVIALQKYLFCNLAGLRPHGLYAEYKNEMSSLWNNIDYRFFAGWPHDGFVEWQGDCVCGSGGHPLELGHERISNKIYEHIRNIGWFS